MKTALLLVWNQWRTSYKEKEALRLVGSQQNCFSSFWPFSITCWAPSVKSGDTTAENQSEDSKFTSWTRSSTVMEFAVCPVFPGGDDPAESEQVNRWVYCLWDQQMYWKDVICTIIHFVWCLEFLFDTTHVVPTVQICFLRDSKWCLSLETNKNQLHD